MVELCFVAYEDKSLAHEGPGLARPTSSAIRSHARRAAHRQARHERMNEYRKQSLQSTENSVQENEATRMQTFPNGAVRLGSPSGYLDSLRRNPFQSLAFPVNQVEQTLIDYFKLRFPGHASMKIVRSRHPPQDVTVFAPNPSPGCTVMIPAELYRHQVATQWVPFAFADRCLLNGLFLQSCRKIADLQGHPRAEFYEKLALGYKIACAQLLRASFSSEATAPSDAIIAGSLFLALDEMHEQNVKEAMVHVRAIELMVELRGGEAFLGLEGFLGRLVSLCRFHVGHTRA
ncbi:hypothetical protein ANO11243_042390 [Dothideomycetidae sp. 11243]|nr:hypothetical protein ANO11243_042390 [fungal sp. No.11243]